MRRAQALLGVTVLALGLLSLSMKGAGGAVGGPIFGATQGGAALAAAEGHDVPASPFPFLTIPSIQALTVIEPNTLLAGSFGMGMFRSEDRGQTWTPVNDGLADLFVLSLVTMTDGTVYAGTVRGGIFRSEDSGKSWQVVNKGLKRLQVKALLATDRGLFAGTGNGVYRLNEPGGRWSMVSTGLEDILVHCLAMAKDGSLYAGTSGKGVMLLAKGTAGWKRLTTGLKDHEGLRENFIRVIAIGADQAIYAGTFDGGVFRSGDSGRHWSPISRALPNDSIRGIVPTAAGLFVGTGRGVFRALDQEGEWASVNGGLTELSIQALVASHDGALYAGTNAGAFRSDDGTSWIAINKGLEGSAQSPFDMFR